MTVRRHPSLGNITEHVDDEVTHLTCCLTDLSFCGIDCSDLEETNYDNDRVCQRCEYVYGAYPGHCPSDFDCLQDPS